MKAPQRVTWTDSLMGMTKAARRERSRVTEKAQLKVPKMDSGKDWWRAQQMGTLRGIPKAQPMVLLRGSSKDQLMVLQKGKRMVPWMGVQMD
ncbi:MAG: hypothetical protein ACRCYW_13595 [Aeromonas sp.]|uniref:hypothetical protein n=1 Tax=Aeromonas sp. TaxID=647 RepID=UPI003F377EE8